MTRFKSEALSGRVLTRHFLWLASMLSTSGSGVLEWLAKSLTLSSSLLAHESRNKAFVQLVTQKIFEFLSQKLGYFFIMHTDSLLTTHSERR